eukprot:SAG11_NODE_20727_length_439_cov_1.200000_1_plen_82_part_01
MSRCFDTATLVPQDNEVEVLHGVRSVPGKQINLTISESYAHTLCCAYTSVFCIRRDLWTKVIHAPIHEYVLLAQTSLKWREH